MMLRRAPMTSARGREGVHDGVPRRGSDRRHSRDALLSLIEDRDLEDLVRRDGVVIGRWVSISLMVALLLEEERDELGKP